MENAGCIPQGHRAATESRYPNYGGCFSVCVIHRTLTCTIGPLTSAQMLKHAYGVVRESALKVDSVKQIPCRAGESNLRPRGLSVPTLYQLGCIPIPIARKQWEGDELRACCAREDIAYHLRHVRSVINENRYGFKSHAQPTDKTESGADVCLI